ncbi:MAG: hypothetical protein QM594_13245 [Niabella sp.]
MHGEGFYEYNSGKGTTIKIAAPIPQGDLSGLTVTITYNEKYTYQLWGTATNVSNAAQHENLNGKHIKDRIGNNRTAITPDGTKITLVSTSPEASVTALTIYSSGSVHHFNVSCRKLEYSTLNLQIASRLDELQADGETSIFDDTETIVFFYNIYNEETPGNKVHQRVDLGFLPKNNPKQVNDLYDDPRLAHT